MVRGGFFITGKVRNGSAALVGGMIVNQGLVQYACDCTSLKSITGGPNKTYWDVAAS